MTFWRQKKLNELSHDEWESICDGCGKCCLHKIEDEDTGVIYYTSVACRLFDITTCRCKDYQRRIDKVPDCVNIKKLATSRFKWLPSTCAYRLLEEGNDLPLWHPLVSGRASSVAEAGVGVASFAVPESQVRHVEEHIIQWLE